MVNSRSRSIVIFLASLGFLFLACNLPGVSTASDPTEIIEPGVETATEDSLPTPDVAGSEIAATQTPEVAPTLTPAPTEVVPQVTAQVNANCRTGPSTVFDPYGFLLAGESAALVGRTNDSSWYQVQLEGLSASCWISASIIDINVDPETLPVIASPPTPTPSPGSIGGVFWRDRCLFTGGEGGEPVVLGLGCIMYGPNPEDFGANAVFDDFEEGFAGVTLHLGSGACPSTGLATTMTDVNGRYAFTGLSSGTFCVSYSALSDGNDAILIPGWPTYPVRFDAGRMQSVTLAAGENRTGVDFGWQWQFGD